MIFAIIVLLSALSISVIAAYYSIIGLTTIFGGAVLAVAIMGSALEVGKIVTATWLHKNWSTAPTLMKGYLTFAVFVLMFITSMGIFGYLSKAHLTQGAPVSVVQTQIDQIDFTVVQEQQLIIQEQKNIAASQRVIDQLDKSMDLYFEKGIIRRALRERDKQKLEREAEQKEIVTANSNIKSINEKIAGLTSEKFKLNQQIKNFEVEVGPIKYIAELVYGEARAKSLLDQTVRYVILTLIFVFDPLAILLIIAANISFAQNSSKNKQLSKPTTITPPTLSDIDYNIGPRYYIEKPEPESVVIKPTIDQPSTPEPILPTPTDTEGKLAIPEKLAAKAIAENEAIKASTRPQEASKADIDSAIQAAFKRADSASQVPFNLESEGGIYLKKLVKEEFERLLTNPNKSK